MKLIWNAPFGRQVFVGDPDEIWEQVRWALFVNKVDATLEDISSLFL